MDHVSEMGLVLIRNFRKIHFLVIILLNNTVFMHVTNVFQESEKMADSKKNSTAREQVVLKIQNSAGIFGKNEIIYENFSRK